MSNTLRTVNKHGVELFVQRHVTMFSHERGTAYYAVWIGDMSAQQQLLSSIGYGLWKLIPTRTSNIVLRGVKLAALAVCSPTSGEYFNEQAAFLRTRDALRARLMLVCNEAIHEAFPETKDTEAGPRGVLECAFVPTTQKAVTIRPIERRTANARVTALTRLAELDEKFGRGKGAAKERAKLEARLAKS